MRRNTSAALVVVMLALSACSTPESDHSTLTTSTSTISTADRYAANASTLVHRWFAPEYVDLEAPEIQVARAYRESDNLYRSTGDRNATYPGYVDLFRREISDQTIAFPRVGTIDDHIFDVRPARDRHGRAVIRIAICEDRTGVAESTGSTWAVRETAIGVFILAVRRTDDTVHAPVLDPTVRLPYPTWNVFDGWSVEDNLDDLRDLASVFSSNNPHDNEIQVRCSRDRRPRLNPTVSSGDILTTAPAVETPIPGWPTEINGAGK